MIGEIRKRLENGERVELECIDEHGFLYHQGGADFRSNSKILSRGRITVDCVDCDGDVEIEQGSFILGSELQYFRIKDEGCTFNDLIDVAVQAYSDNVVDVVEVVFDSGLDKVQIYIDDKRTVFYRSGNIKQYIERIKSLYKETFTIEEKNDLRMIQSGAMVELCNGTELVRHRIEAEPEASLSFIGEDGERLSLSYSILKGAKVTQQYS